MSRMQTPQVRPAAPNNVFTGLLGGALAVTVMSIVLIGLRWSEISAEKLFFWPF